MSVGGPCSIEGCERVQMYNNPVCYKHKDQKSKPKQQKTGTESPHEVDLWWTEDDESRRCDDTPDTAVCEFNTYDGICFHCKNLVYPDVHLIHLIHNDRNGILNFELDLARGEYWGNNYRSRLFDIWGEYEERDIAFEPSLKPDIRAAKLQQMCYADKKYILSEAKENLSKAGAPTEGEGMAPWVWNSIEGALIEHFERIRNWDIERVEWSPKEWGLENTRHSDLSDLAPWDSGPMVRDIIGVLVAAFILYGILNGN